MASESVLPLLRGRIHRTDPFQSVFGFNPDKPTFPSRDPAKHRAYLVKQLDTIHKAVAGRRSGERVQDATREIVVFHPDQSAPLDPSRLADSRSDARLIGVDTDSGAVLIDTPSVELNYLHRKLEDYADDAKVSKKGARRNEAAFAPLDKIVLVQTHELAGNRVRAANLSKTTMQWFELACRGGYEQSQDSETSRSQFLEAFKRIQAIPPQEYEATDRIVFFARLSVVQLERLILMVDCIYEFELSLPPAAAILTYEDGLVHEIREFKIIPPSADAPSVALLDTGVATNHPLLKPLIAGVSSVVPGFEASPEDTDGHGTEMAGVAGFWDITDVIDRGGHRASHWIESCRVMVADGVATASEEFRSFWPKMTIEAVARIEESGSRNRLFATAIAAESEEPGMPSYWSHAVDTVAYNHGDGRVFFVCVGNADSGRISLLNDYPTMNLEEKLWDPAQAINAITVGAYTARAQVTPLKPYESYVPIAPSEGISPHTSSGLVRGADAIKPDVVFEGGNVGIAAELPDPSIPSLVGLTTGHRFETGRPLSLIWATSEATARAAWFGAQIWSAHPDFRPETVRALVVHSASWTERMSRQFPNIDERLAICGHGVPDLDFATTCATDRATIIIEDELPNATVELEEQGGKRKPKEHFSRSLKLFSVPLPEDLLLDAGDSEVELRVTLSYLAEPNTFRGYLQRGLDLRWDMQGPHESATQFLERINKLAREGGKRADKTKTFPWMLGIRRRSRGSVQRDSWRGPASLLARSKQLAVYPSLGWWDRKRETKLRAQRFAVVVSVIGPGIELYNPIATELKAVIPIEV